VPDHRDDLLDRDHPEAREADLTIGSIETDIRDVRSGPTCGTEPTRRCSSRLNASLDGPKEIHMYVGGGILGTILLIVLIVYLLRRV
jgi:hypothetical protein